MAIRGVLAALLPRVMLRYAERLRFPQLFLVFAVLFVVDLLIPDFIPFIDELFLGLLTLVFANLKNRRPTPTTVSKKA